MSLISTEMQKEKQEYSSIGFKSLRKNLRQLPQTGTTNRIVDASKKALLPGKRISKTGKTYWESRVNRSDKSGSAI